MCKHLRTAAMIMLIIFTLSPLVSFACSNGYHHKDCDSESDYGSDSGNGSSDGTAPVNVLSGDNFLGDAWNVAKGFIGPFGEAAQFVLKYLPVPESMDPNERIPGSTMPFLDPIHDFY